MNARKKQPYNPRVLNLENYMHPDHFGEMLGYRMCKFKPGSARAEAILQVGQRHLSSAGRVHGGVISSFFDFTLGGAVFTTLGPRDFCSTVELKVNYLRPLNLGDSLRCKTQVVFRGKRLCVVHGFIYRKGTRDPVAMATATFNVVGQKK